MHACQLIPASCPFERDIKFFNRILLHILSLYKLNPLYEQLLGLRFRALLLAEQTGEEAKMFDPSRFYRHSYIYSFGCCLLCLITFCL